MNKPYQPKTGVPCFCKRGIQRDNCPSCEGTGRQIDFKLVRQASESLYFYCSRHDTSFRISDGCPFCNIQGGLHEKRPATIGVIKENELIPCTDELNKLKEFLTNKTLVGYDKNYPLTEEIKKRRRYFGYD